MRFSKYHGAGNDFVMLADPEGRLGPRGTLAAELVRAICDRHTGVGADGVIRVLPSETSARYMDYYNADGSTAEMCGNGIRCLVLHEQDAGRLAGGDHEIETPSRVVTVKGAGRGRFTVDMGLPGERAPVEVSLDGDSLAGSTVSMGNPHLVLFCDVIGRALDDGTVRSLGPPSRDPSGLPRANERGVRRCRERDDARGACVGTGGGRDHGLRLGRVRGGRGRGVPPAHGTARDRARPRG